LNLDAASSFVIHVSVVWSVAYCQCR